MSPSIINEAWANISLPITVARGDLLVGQSQDNVQVLPIGNLGQVLAVGANGRPGWSSAPTLTSLTPDGSAASPTLVFATETGSGRYRINNNNFGESINSAEVFEWNASRILFARGYQQIFQGSASGAVTIQAQSAAGTWTFQWPTGVGNANQVLTTDGVSGVMTWATPAGNPFSDASALVKNAADNTKLALFSAASISAGTTRTYTLPNVAGGTLITTADSGTVSNAMLANSSITVQGSSVSLGGSTLATSATPQFARLGLGVAAGSTALLTLNGGGAIAPSADSTTALVVTKADGSTAVLTFDTTNNRLTIAGQISQGSANSIFGTNSIGINGASSGHTVAGPNNLIGWSAAGISISSLTPDTALGRNGAGVVEFNNGTAGTFRDWKARTGNLTGLVATYNNISTTGGGVPAIYGLDNRTGLTGADGAATTLYTTVNSTSLFRITADIFATVYSSGTATYTVTWTQNSVTRTLVVTAAALNTLGTGTDLINPDNATTITAQLTGVFSATVTVAAVVEILK